MQEKGAEAEKHVTYWIHYETKNAEKNQTVIGRYRFDSYPISYESYFLVFRTKLCISSGEVLFNSYYIFTYVDT